MSFGDLMDTNADIKNIDIGRLRQICLEMWDSTSDDFPMLHRRYTDSDHAANHARLKTYIGDIVKLVGGFDGKTGQDPVAWGSCLKRLIYESGISMAGLDDPGMKLLLNGGFCEATADFIEQARAFDMSFGLDDIFQSLRNVWIMNCIQVLLGIGISVTPSVFAYSMLYPYTDNFLDAGKVSERQKRETNDRLEKRLGGEPVRSETLLENRLFKLVEMIEGQFDRKLFPMVYRSLIGIHAAQVRSMRQDKGSPLSLEEIKDISAEKGGCSVLADGYLVKGSLTEDEAVFIFCFGMLLQLVDDLQDAADDRRNGHSTLFSVNGSRTSVQSITNRLINYTCRLLEDNRLFAGDTAVTMMRTIKNSIILLIMGAAACNSRIYERAYLEELERYCPVSFKELKGCYSRVEREYLKLKMKLAVKSLEVPMARAFAAGILV